MLVALVMALAFAGPPKLPPLPTRGMRTVEKPAEQPQPKPKPKPKPLPEPASPPKPPPEQKAAPKKTAAPRAEPKAPAIAPKASKPKPKAPAGQPPAKDGEFEPLPAASPEELAALNAPPPEPSKPAAKRKADAEDVTVVRTATEESGEKRLTFRRRPHPPKRSAAFIFGYRQFQLSDALGRQQSWHFASIEVTPVRRYVRLNLLTEIGLEGGEAARNGDRADVMLLQKAGLGAQYPHWVTPFVEFQAGIGGARVELFERNDLLLVYTLGIDAGAQWAVTRWLFVHAAIGWIRPVLRRPDGPVRYDRFTFKVGLGF